MSLLNTVNDSFSPINGGFIDKPLKLIFALLFYLGKIVVTLQKRNHEQKSNITTCLKKAYRKYIVSYNVQYYLFIFK